jgi:diguanylate cyclase
MTTSVGHHAVGRSIVDLGHNLALQVVGEGVETEEIASALTATGCDMVQGYLYARSMPAERLSEWIASHEAMTLGLVATE